MDVLINAAIDALPEGCESIDQQGNYYHQMLTCLGYPKEAPPVGDLLRRYHGLKGEWLVASPIHWQATHNDAMIIASGPSLQLTEQESRIWFAELSQFASIVDIHLHYHDAYTWLIQSDDKPPVTSKPVHQLHHQSMMPELKKLDETMFWQHFITENQMFFSDHPLNRARTHSPTINGLWLWGAGQLHGPVQTPLVCADEKLLRLAHVLSTNTTLYAPEHPIAKQSVLLFNELSLSERTAIETRLKKDSARWYWNNLAYLRQPKRWWSRFSKRV